MNGDEVLQGSNKSEKENYKDNVKHKTITFSKDVIIIIFLILMAYKFYKGLPTEDLFGLAFAYNALNYISEYKVNKSKLNFFAATFSLIASIVFFYGYISQTW